MSDLISNATLAAKGDAMITTLLIVGIVFAVFLADKLGRIWLLYGLVISSILGAIVTWMYRIETTGINLDHVGEAESEMENSKAVA